MRVYVAESQNEGISSNYKDLASQVATVLAHLNFTLVSKGFDTGMINKSIMTYKYENGSIIGVADVNNADMMDTLDIENNKVVKNTFERTKEIFNICDFVIILPGGIGTLAELFSFLEEIKVKNIMTKVILFNYNNYYDNLLKFLINCYHEGFISDENLKLISIVNDIRSLKEYLKNWER